MALPKAEAEKLHNRLARASGDVDQFGIPPLESGDRLTRDEFERRYNAMPNVKKAELIEGVVYMPSPVRHLDHGKQRRQIVTWLGNYCDATPGTDSSDNCTVRLDTDNDPQPDVVLFIEESSGGQIRLSADGYIERAPELVVEVAGTSDSRDLYDSTLSILILKSNRQIELCFQHLGNT